LGVKAADA